MVTFDNPLTVDNFIDPTVRGFILSMQTVNFGQLSFDAVQQSETKEKQGYEASQCLAGSERSVCQMDSMARLQLPGKWHCREWVENGLNCRCSNQSGLVSNLGEDKA